MGFGSGIFGSRVAEGMKHEKSAIDIGVISSAPVEFRFEIPGTYYAGNAYTYAVLFLSFNLNVLHLCQNMLKKQWNY